MTEKRNVRKELENRSLKEILAYVKKTVKYLYDIDNNNFLLIVLLEGITTIFPIIILLLLQRIINEVIIGNIPYFFIIFWCIVTISNKILTNISNRLNNDFKIDIRKISEKSLYNKVCDLRIEDFESKHIYNTSNRAVLAISNFISIFDEGKKIVFDFINVIIYSIIIIIWKPIFLLIILAMPIINCLFTSKILKENFIKMWEASELFRKVYYYAYTLTKFESLNELKILNVDKIFKDKHHEAVDNVQEEIRKIESSNIKQMNKISIIDHLFQIFYFIYLIFQVIKGLLKIGTFNTYRTAFFNISIYTNKFTNNLLQINVWLLEVKEFFKFVEYDNKYMNGFVTLEDIKSIEFKNVSYRYNSSKKDAISNVSFKMKKGEKIAIIGENGSGKTTIMKLLTKVYDASEGKIYINGIDIYYINTKSLRECITMLTQDFNLFEETVSFNIAFKEKERSSLYNKIPFEDFKEKIEKLPNKSDTILGSWFGKGINFSKGELQKLALSRVFYKQTPCYILDEPNSALDPKSEKDLFDYINNSLMDKLCIITLHNFANINTMDRIIMFNQGKVVCEGTHYDLYNNNNHYKEFYNIQIKN